VDAADEIVAVDVPVSHESAAMYTSSVENAVTLAVRPLDDYEIHARHQRMHQAARLNL
jgi:hypothetical protein